MLSRVIIQAKKNEEKGYEVWRYGSDERKAEGGVEQAT